MKNESFENRYGYQILIAGVTRNSGSSILEDVKRLQKAFLNFTKLQWLIIESDSSDDTLEKLQSLENNVPGFRFISLGNLSNRLPLRTERISHCRNYYVQEFKNDARYKEVDYVVVADLDNLNTLLTDTAISSCWSRKDWDVCTANQRGPYYDVFALRHPLWSNEDTSKCYQFYKSLGVSEYRAMCKAVYSKMITIPQNADWIPVDSAFGGFAIYKKEAFENIVYQGTDTEGNEICEHVPASLGLTKKGFRILINPALINCGYNEHTHKMKHLFLYKIRLDYLPFKQIRKYLPFVIKK